MAMIRVFLLTYRRPRLLRRALASLQAQTFTNWVCELHNDDPQDDFPARLLVELGDARITLHQHEANWGPVKCFNHVFAGGTEPYASLLEDDNWWDPQFLASALTTIESQPSASLVWANMRIWREETNGAWTDTGQTIWAPPNHDIPARNFRWPEGIQISDALHSNGAMIFRPRTFHPMTVPDDAPFAIIESLRERAAQGELFLLTKPLAHFSQTIATSRGHHRGHWRQWQILLCASYLEAVTLDANSLDRIWAQHRSLRPRDTNLLFLTAISLRRPQLLTPAQLTDYLFFLLNFVRHLRTNLTALRFRRDQADLWAWFNKYTQPGTVRTTPLVLNKREF